jgi:hypothetical protein
MLRQSLIFGAISVTHPRRHIFYSRCHLVFRPQKPWDQANAERSSQSCYVVVFGLVVLCKNYSIIDYKKTTRGIFFLSFRIMNKWFDTDLCKHFNLFYLTGSRLNSIVSKQLLFNMVFKFPQENKCPPSIILTCFENQRALTRRTKDASAFSDVLKLGKELYRNEFFVAVLPAPSISQRWRWSSTSLKQPTDRQRHIIGLTVTPHSRTSRLSPWD